MKALSISLPSHSSPQPPSPPPPSQFGLGLQASVGDVVGGGVSIMQAGAFLGFSIEMSVVDQVGEWVGVGAVPLCSC